MDITVVVVILVAALAIGLALYSTQGGSKSTPNVIIPPGANPPGTVKPPLNPIGKKDKEPSWGGGE